MQIVLMSNNLSRFNENQIECKYL